MNGLLKSLRQDTVRQNTVRQDTVRRAPTRLFAIRGISWPAILGLAAVLATGPWLAGPTLAGEQSSTPNANLEPASTATPESRTPADFVTASAAVQTDANFTADPLAAVAGFQYAGGGQWDGVAGRGRGPDWQLHAASPPRFDGRCAEPRRLAGNRAGICRHAVDRNGPNPNRCLD